MHIKAARPVLYALILSFIIMSLAGCGQKQKFSTQKLGLFDSFVIITGYCKSSAEFTETSQKILDELETCDALFDIYSEHEGSVNLCTVNRLAGLQSVQVDDRICGLLKFGREVYNMTDGQVNIMMGSVLSLWHEARTADDSRLPDSSALAEAANHTSIDLLSIDGDRIYISDPAASLDVGALAKGYAAQLVAAMLPDGWLLNLGGNIYAGSAHDGTKWKVGVQDPDGSNDYAAVLSVENTAVVTSGDYQRYYTVDGKRYNHIIDCKTLFPAEIWRSVTVISEDAALADALSTALFLADRESGIRLLDKYGASAIWIEHEGNISAYGPKSDSITNDKAAK